MLRPTLAALACAAVFTVSVRAQTAPPSWMIQDILPAAKSEGALTVYSSVNEQEGLPLWKEFENATGIKIAYTRGNEAQLTSRMQIEQRTGQHTWDVLMTTNVTRLPNPWRAVLDLPLARELDDKFKDPKKSWHAVYANYNVPQFNTKLTQVGANPPKDMEEFLKRKDWIGKVGIDAAEYPWLRAMIMHYGEEKGWKLVNQFFSEFKVTPVDGHLSLARAIGAGEYWVTPANYLNLVNNVASAGAPTDYWGMDPVALILGQVAVNAKAPHPKAAMLAANFLISREGQKTVSRVGRLPIRSDVPPVPENAITKLGKVALYPIELTPDEEKTWQKRLQDLIRGR